VDIENRDLTYSNEIPEKTDSEGRRVELWPGFNCSFCRRGETIVRWEESSYPDDSTAPDHQQYDGLEPSCRACGLRVSEDNEETYRPPIWHQPFLYVASGVEGMNTSHPAVENLIEEYNEAPMEFLTAHPTELESVKGIGETFADRLHTTRATVYPEHTPEVEGALYKFRGRRLRDIDPSQLARDLVIGHTTVEDLPTTNDTNDKEVLQKAADTLRENSTDQFWNGGRDPEIIEQLATEVEP